MVGAIAPSDNPLVTFNTFVLDAVRRTPIEDDWQRQVCCNTFGLVAETTKFMRLCRRWTMGEALPARYLLVRQLGPLESYRALICYQLHLSPVEVPMPGLVECSLESAVSELVLQAGHLAGVMRVWVSSGKWLDRLAVRDGRALMQLRPHTGQTHQLRVHLAALGLPIEGDRIYPTLLPEPAPGEAPDYGQPLQLLARAIAFTDPVTGEARHFVSRRQLRF